MNLRPPGPRFAGLLTCAVATVFASSFAPLRAQNSQQPGAQRTTTPPFMVCIDPGHPSETSRGASGHGVTENHLNWVVALKLQQKLSKLGVASVLTKQREDQLVTNRQRAEIANAYGCALFIRLHCDAGPGQGFTWYYPDRSATKYGVTGPPVEVQQASREAAHVLNEAMKPVLRGHLASNPIKTDAATGVGGKQGGVLTGSIFARVPTALLEMCFINRKRDVEFLKSAAGQDKMATALASGVLSWKERWEAAQKARERSAPRRSPR